MKFPRTTSHGRRQQGWTLTCRSRLGSAPGQVGSRIARVCSRDSRDRIEQAPISLGIFLFEIVISRAVNPDVGPDQAAEARPDRTSGV